MYVKEQGLTACNPATKGRDKHWAASLAKMEGRVHWRKIPDTFLWLPRYLSPPPHRKGLCRLKATVSPQNVLLLQRHMGNCCGVFVHCVRCTAVIGVIEN